MKFHFTLIALLIASGACAQVFLGNKTGEPLTFREMQLQFDEWKKNKDLKSEKHWKYFKRWEMDMQMHANGKGERGNPAEYIDAITKAAKEKEAAASSKFATASWYPVGPNWIPANQTGYMENGIGRINCISFHPTDANTYYVGVAQGGVWKTVNNGQTWAPITDNLPITRISDIAIDASDPNNTMYISVCDFEYVGVGLYLDGRKRNSHYGLGVYKTTDGGATWQPTGLTFQLTDGDASLIRRVLVHPTNSSQLVACGVSGMYISSDAGATWTKNLDSLFWDMVQDPVNPNVLYAASGWVMNANDGHAAIYKSTDFGATWTMLSTGIPMQGAVQRIKLAIAPSDNNYIYALAVDTQRGLYGFYKSTNAGSSWQYINPGVNILEGGQGNNSGGQGTYDLGFMVSASNRDLLYAGGVNLWGSSDGAQTWQPASHWTLYYGPTIHADIHFIERHPITNEIYVCNDGGISRTSNVVLHSWTSAQNGIDWPTQWTNISNGMAVTSFYRLSSSKNATGRLMAGSQDNASFYYDNGTWSTIFGGDGMDNYLPPYDDDAVLGSSQYGWFYLSYDDGISDIGIDPNVNWENGEWTTPVVANDNNPYTMYVGYENVVKSIDGGVTWTALASFPNPTTNEVSALAVAKSNGNVIYAAKRVRHEFGLPGSVYRTTNGGSSWTDITSNLPDSLFYTSIEVSETDANTAYITMAGFDAALKVFKTSDGGSTWQNISYNLPNLPVNCIKYIPGSGGMLIAATDIGVYTLQPSSTAWTNQSTGLPNVIVSDIEFNAAINKIYISTFGRGIWATDLDVFVGIKETGTATLDAGLFPSLNNGSFTIKVGGISEELSLEVIDIKGSVVHSSTIAGAGTYSYNLDLPAGMYFAKMRGKAISAVKKFVVE
jgi:photosystem II stability/assembly factor-like uncharacterized protein